MQINFKGHRLEVTPALKAFTEDKLTRLERHFEKITSINITFDVEKLRQIVEATILIAKGEVHASAEAENMYAAIDELMDKLDKQLMKHKEKKLDHRDHSVRPWDEEKEQEE